MFSLSNRVLGIGDPRLAFFQLVFVVSLNRIFIEGFILKWEEEK